MKKILFFLCVAITAPSVCESDTKESRKHWFTAFSAGYAFKHDSQFKDVYGHGMVNIITADTCYYVWKKWGLGAKLSYWRAKGHTSFLGQPATIREVPGTFYVRRKKDFKCGLGAYASVGLGFVWLKEKSYLGDVHTTKAIGEVEGGLYYPIWRFINVTGAFRYLFPHQTQGSKKVDVGGIDLRAGLAFSF